MTKSPGLIQNMKARPILYLMALPGFLFLVLFKLIPDAGMVIAFQDFNIFSGLFDSEWVGWANFQTLFQYSDFWRIFGNSLWLGVLKVAFTFPVPIMLALLINEMAGGFFKRFSQTAVYLPHFLSWVIVSQIFITVLSPQGGLVNSLIQAFGGAPIYFMAQEQWFGTVFIASSLWKETGYESIIYLAALAAIPKELYEAAAIDGAKRWEQLLRITLPSLLPTITIVFLLRLGSFLEIGFDQIWTLANPLVWPVADIFDTYLYRAGVLGGGYSLATAIGMFKSVLTVLFLLGGNALAKRFTGRGIF